MRILCVLIFLLSVTIVVNSVSSSIIPRLLFHDYEIRNISSNSPPNTFLFTAYIYGNKQALYSVDNDLFRVHSNGSVYSRVGGQRLLQEAPIHFQVSVYYPGNTLVQKLKVKLVRSYAPKFLQSSKSFTINDTARAGFLVGVLSSYHQTDKIFYYFRSDDLTLTDQLEMFTISKHSGVIRVAKIEPIEFTEVSYNFTAVVVDTRNISDSMRITINIHDINNHAPVFENCGEHAEVEEEAYLDTEVLTLRATDKDRGENAEITYSFYWDSKEEMDPAFLINSSSGQITSYRLLNRDYPDWEKKIRVVVRAQDGGVPSLSSFCVFYVDVIDVNDNPPLFDMVAYRRTISPSTPVGTTVLYAVGTDDDDGLNAQVVYELVNVSLNYFEIDPHNGALRLANPIVFLPQGTMVNLTARISDLGSPTQSTITYIYITIQDVNAKPPVFIQFPNLYYTIPETFQDRNKPIACVKATSGYDRSSAVYYRMITGRHERTNSKGTFEVEETADGKACVMYHSSRPLDYETVKSYNLTIRVTNMLRLWSDISFVLNIEDMNDERPKFFRTDDAYIKENMPAGTYVTKVDAKDYDGTSPNNKVYYHLDSKDGATKNFVINTTSGVITSKRPFDRENEQQLTFTLTVIAEDGANSDFLNTNSPNTARQHVFVRILDDNDNGPVFVANATYSAFVDENSHNRTRVIVVMAEDKDENPSIRYEITDGNTLGAFHIGATSGVIYPTSNAAGVSSLDYETLSHYQLTVVASDGKHEVSRVVEVHVNNVNDVQPEFDRWAYEVHIVEGVVKPDSLVQVHATDTDPIEGDLSIVYKLNGFEIYDKYPNDSILTVDRDGHIRMNWAFDCDVGTGGRLVWNFRVFALEDGGTGHASAVDLIVYVSDINDNAPYLIQDAASPPTIPENLDPQDISISIEANDYDNRTKNGPPYTILIDPNASAEIRSQFAVTAIGRRNRAEIRPLVQFDREEQKVYYVPVLVGDNPNSVPRSMTGTSMFKIVIGDENDNDMSDGSTYLRVFNLDGKMPDIKIGRVFVNDLDDWDLHDKSFEWLEGESYNNFKLDKDTGWITLLKNTFNGTYHLKFKVYDRKFQSEAEGTVIVDVVYLPRFAVEQSASIRFSDISAFKYINTRDKKSSYMSRTTQTLAEVLHTSVDNVYIFNIADNDYGGVDVRYAAHGSPYYRREYMDGLALLDVVRLEQGIGLSISQIPVDDCSMKDKCRRGHCSSQLRIHDNDVYHLHTNDSSIVGVKTEMIYSCDICLPNPVRLQREQCLNGGRWSVDKQRCVCRSHLNGPNCEGTAISFEGEGYVWLPTFSTCGDTHLSLNVSTVQSNGLLIYSGPLVQISRHLSGLFMMDVYRRRIRVLYNTHRLMTSRHTCDVISDGQQHRVEVHVNSTHVRLSVDARPQCTEHARLQTREARRTLAPLQVGGVAGIDLDTLADFLDWKHKHLRPVPFSGCISHLVVNNYMYDLSSPAAGSNYAYSCSAVMNAIVGQTTNQSLLIVTICASFVLILLLIILLLLRRRREKAFRKLPLDGMRDRVVSYDDEGGGEKDQTAYDLSVLRVNSLNRRNPSVYYPSHTPSVKAFIKDNKQRIDTDMNCNAPDELRKYAYEGGDSVCGSLSSLNTDVSDRDLEMSFLNACGHKFDSLASLYTGEAETLRSRTGGPPDESWC